jgi:hypothetical protein
MAGEPSAGLDLTEEVAGRDHGDGRPEVRVRPLAGWLRPAAGAVVLQPRYCYDPELDERVGRCAVAWAAPAGAAHPWVSLPGVVGSSDILVWWQLGRRLACGRRRRPRIEVRGVHDPDAVAAEAGWVFEHVAWWIVAGIDPRAAEQWVRVGVRFGPAAAGWVRALGDELQPHFDGRPLATRRHGCWRPTEWGREVVGRLAKLGVGPSQLRRGIPRRLARASGGDLDAAMRMLERWEAVIPSDRWSPRLAR